MTPPCRPGLSGTLGGEAAFLAIALGSATALGPAPYFGEGPSKFSEFTRLISEVNALLLAIAALSAALFSAARCPLKGQHVPWWFEGAALQKRHLGKGTFALRQQMEHTESGSGQGGPCIATRAALAATDSLSAPVQALPAPFAGAGSGGPAIGPRGPVGFHTDVGGSCGMRPRNMAA
jgi:hypothetical protein